MLSAIATETTPASNDACAPQIIRLSKSRPSSSVPIQWAVEGALRTAPQSVSAGPGIGKIGAATAMMTKNATIKAPNSAAVLLRSFAQILFRRGGKTSA